jgi:hypothetical protein
MSHDDGSNQGGNRRRLSRIVHDSRGNAQVEWIDLPAEDLFLEPRLRLSLEGESPRPDAVPPPAPLPARKKTDLRKLSDWIKLTRELEERKKRE